MTTRSNPCKYRFAGCTAVVPRDGRCCEPCRIAHNKREAKRRRTRRKVGGCWVCGQPARVVDGETQRTCELHVSYRWEMTP